MKKYLCLLMLLVLPINVFGASKFDETVTAQFCNYMGINNDGKYTISTVIENVEKQQEKTIIGVRFELNINNKIDSKYTLGVIGIGDSQDDAFVNAFSDWGGYFIVPFKEYFINSNDRLITEKYILYSSSLGIRGDIPNDSIRDGIKRKTSLINIADEYLKFNNENVCTALIDLVVDKNKVGGECRINGKISKGLTNKIRNSDLFKKGNTKRFLLKEYFIIVKK